MKIIEPSVQYWKESTQYTNEHIARCARICYRSKNNNDEKLVTALWNNNHRSMYRHATKYFCLPKHYLKDYALAYYFDNNPFIATLITDTDIFVSANLQWIKEHDNFYNVAAKWEISDIDIFNLAKENNDIYNVIRYTFVVTTQISTSRELNRVSPNNIAEQSTRYVYEDGTLCRPHWMTDEDYKIFKDEHKDDTFIPEHYLNNDDKIKIRKYVWSCDRSFFDYKNLIKLGMDKQDARGVLPLDTATVCTYTYSGYEWKHILDLRYRGTTGKPHPNAYIIGVMIHNQLQILTKGQLG